MMKNILSLMALASMASALSQYENLATEPAPAGVKDLDWDIFSVMNKMRTDPTYFIPYLEERLDYFDGNILKMPGETWKITREGAGAVEGGIEFLQTQQPLAEFEWRSGMAHACQDHVEQMGPAGQTGSVGLDGSNPFTRMNRYGTWGVEASAILSYGYNTGVDIIMQLLVDDGNYSRGNRDILFKNVGVTGIFSGPHTEYTDMSCINYARTYVNNEEHADEDQSNQQQGSSDDTDTNSQAGQQTGQNGQANSTEIDELQQELNDYVLNFALASVTGQCNYNLRTETDHALNAIKVVAAHNCPAHAIILDIYYNTTDFEDRILREFEVVDDDTGLVVFGNEEVFCNTMANNITACQYKLSPTNPRFGLLMAINSSGLLENQARFEAV